MALKSNSRDVPDQMYYYISGDYHTFYQYGIGKKQEKGKKRESKNEKREQKIENRSPIT